MTVLSLRDINVGVVAADLELLEELVLGIRAFSNLESLTIRLWALPTLLVDIASTMLKACRDCFAKKPSLDVHFLQDTPLHDDFRLPAEM